MGRESISDEAVRELHFLRERLRVISEVTRRFAEATTGYGALLDDVARCLTEVVSDSAVVLLLDETGTKLDAVSQHAVDPAVLEGFRARFVGRQLELSQHPSLAQVLQTGKAQLERRLADRTDVSPEQRHWQEKTGLHTALAVALRVQGRSIGVLALTRFRPGTLPFEPSDVELAQLLADHAGVSVDAVLPTFGRLVLCGAAGMGFGALNEVVEFAATLMMPSTNVGGYVNTGWDLVANLAGCVIAAIIICTGSHRAVSDE